MAVAIGAILIFWLGYGIGKQQGYIAGVTELESRQPEEYNE